MNKLYQFDPDEVDNITIRFGEDFYHKVLRDIAVYADQWKLSSLQLVASYSANLVFRCYSENYGNVVLKIGNPLFGEIVTELNTLYEYAGGRFCRVFDADIENGIILEECVQPGISLREESSLEQRLSIFCSLYSGLHKTPANAAIYPTYIEWVCRITDYMSKRQDCTDLYAYMQKAKDMCLAVANLYSQKLLLHGDLHHDNILLGDAGQYRIIDPKGVIGDPVFDVPRFILNEFEDEITAELYKKINAILCNLEEKLTIPQDILKQCLYIETTMGACWSVEDGSPPDHYPSLMERVAFADSILNSI